MECANLGAVFCTILMNLGNEVSNPSVLPGGNIIAQRREERVERPEDQENIGYGEVQRVLEAKM